MKLILVTLIVCAFVSTGLSKPVESEQLPPIGGPLMGVHPVMEKTEKTDKMAKYSNESGDLIRGLLQGLVQDLEKIEAGLKSDGKYIEYGRIKLHKNIVKAVAANTHGGNANRKSVQYALDRGIELIKKYEKYCGSSKNYNEYEKYCGSSRNYTEYKKYCGSSRNYAEYKKYCGSSKNYNEYEKYCGSSRNYTEYKKYCGSSKNYNEYEKYCGSSRNYAEYKKYCGSSRNYAEYEKYCGSSKTRQ